MYKAFSMKFAHRCEKHALIFELLTEKAIFFVTLNSKKELHSIHFDFADRSDFS